MTRRGGVTTTFNPTSTIVSTHRDAFQVDIKLLHLIRKITTSLPIGNRDEHFLDYIVNSLCTQHREYQRKDRNWLTQQVQCALEMIDSGQKRKKGLQEDDDDDDQEEKYDQLAVEHDQMVTQSSSSMFNATLRNRYRQQQEALQMQQRQSLQQLEGERKSKSVQEENDKTETAATTTTTGNAVLAGSSPQPKVKRMKRRKTTVNSSSTMGFLENESNSFLVTPVPRPRERFADLGGMDDILVQIRQLVEYPLIRPEVYRHLGVDPPRGVLLRGPPGCGKSHLANAIAGQLGIPYFRVSSPELVSGMSGESESRIRDLFKAASDMAPAIIFMDELDAIAPKRSADGGAGSRGMEKRMVAQLLTCMDRLDPQYNRNHATVIVLGATNRPDSMDSTLRRAGRFDKEILMGVPDEGARQSILQTMTRNMRLSGDFDYKVLARKIPGYVGADIRSLTKEAAVIGINRIFSNVLQDQSVVERLENENEDPSRDAVSGYDILSAVTPLTTEQMEPLFVTMDDFLNAIPMVQPSSKREGFATVPGVTWSDVGALQCVREELTLSVLEPIRNPEKFHALGLPLPSGVLLYGPPGCGKTLLAKAIAHESGTNFISIKGPELLDKYVGESERAVRLVFERARSSSPCVVFFDELDSLCPRRGSDSGNGGGGVSERVVNQLLTEMDGLESRRSVFVIAATNRPELIDPAMMRPGRLDKLLYVPLPSPEDRVSILRALAGKIKLGPDVDLPAIGLSSRAQGYSGADCAALLREAGLAALKEDAVAPCLSLDSLCITNRHFDYAFLHVVPSVSKKDQARYDRMRDRMARARTRGGVADSNESEPVTVLSADDNNVAFSS